MAFLRGLHFSCGPFRRFGRTGRLRHRWTSKQRDESDKEETASHDARVLSRAAEMRYLTNLTPARLPRRQTTWQ